MLLVLVHAVWNKSVESNNAATVTVLGDLSDLHLKKKISVLWSVEPKWWKMCVSFLLVHMCCARIGAIVTIKILCKFAFIDGDNSRSYLFGFYSTCWLTWNQNSFRMQIEEGLSCDITPSFPFPAFLKSILHPVSLPGLLVPPQEMRFYFNPLL